YTIQEQYTKTPRQMQTGTAAFKPTPPGDQLNATLRRTQEQVSVATPIMATPIMATHTRDRFWHILSIQKLRWTTLDTRKKEMDVRRRSIWIYALVAFAISVCILSNRNNLNAQQAAAPKIDGDDIGGIVSSSKGPEAGVWVIAE